jgi:hypothetical protein
MHAQARAESQKQNESKKRLKETERKLCRTAKETARCVDLKSCVYDITVRAKQRLDEGERRGKEGDGQVDARAGTSR